MVVMVHEKNALTLSPPAMLGAAGVPLDSYTIDDTTIGVNYELFVGKLQRYPAISRTPCKLSKYFGLKCLEYVFVHKVKYSNVQQEPNFKSLFKYLALNQLTTQQIIE